MSKPESDDKPILLGSFGHSVYSARRLAGISLREAGQKAGFRGGEYLSMIECGHRVPQLKHVPEIAIAVRADPYQLVMLWIKQYAEPAWQVLQGRLMPVR